MGADNTSNSKIVVTSAYHEMYYHILGFRKRSVSAVRNGGIVLTGQPGVGASLSLNPYPVRQLTGVPLSRKNFIPRLHALAADVGQPGRTPIHWVCPLPLLR